MDLYESLQPADGAESMLATQMVGTHFAALERLRRASISEQTFAERDMALKHAEKLMAIYAKQLVTMNKHRGKGQQRVTVEHVNVAPGCRAIVGVVESGSKIPDSTQDTIEHRAQTTVDDAIPKPSIKPRGSARDRVTCS